MFRRPLRAAPVGGLDTEMTMRTAPWPAGAPCWADLTVPDVAAAQSFYADVLGWTYPDSDEDAGAYVIGHRHGAAAAGIGPQAEPGQPVSWTLYLASDDADATAAAVTAHGGTVLLPPDDSGSLGRMLIARDPAGAVFGVWQAGGHIGASIVGEPGGITWEDLRSTAPDAARTFYAAVFGYEWAPVPMAGPDYTTFSLAHEEPPLGGVGGMMGAEGLPSHWLVYFGVASVPAAVAAAERGGGSVLVPAFDSPYGSMAGLADADGAVFWIVETPG